MLELIQVSTSMACHFAILSRNVGILNGSLLEQVAIQNSICCLSKRFFILEYCELTAMASNITSVSKREKVISQWSSGNCSLTELASIAVAIDESRKTY